MIRLPKNRERLFLYKDDILGHAVVCSRRDPKLKQILKSSRHNPPTKKKSA